MRWLGGFIGVVGGVPFDLLLSMFGFYPGKGAKKPCARRRQTRVSATVQRVQATRWHVVNHRSATPLFARARAGLRPKCSISHRKLTFDASPEPTVYGGAAGAVWGGMRSYTDCAQASSVAVVVVVLTYIY